MRKSIFGVFMSSRVFSYFADIPYSIIREIAERVIKINKTIKNPDEKVIDLSLGQNFLGNPNIILGKINWISERLLNKPFLYEPSLGPIDVREMIVKNFYPYFYSIPSDILTADNIMITDGAFGAVRNALGAIFRPGDLFVMDRITFRYFLQSLVVMGRILPKTRPFIIHSTEETGFIPSPEEVINFLEELRMRYPDKNIVYYTQFGFNPTGCFRSESDLKKIVNYVEYQKNIFLINDIAYHLIRWDKKEVPLASVLAEEGKGIVDAESLSKPFGLMGARVGALITRDKELFKFAARVQQYTIVSPTKLAVDVWRAVSSESNLPAIKEYICKMNSIIKENYEYFTKGVKGFGLDVCKEAKGTIYAFVKVGTRSSQLWKDLLEKAKVAVVPGIAFTDPDDYIGEHFIRVTVSVRRDLLERSLNRIGKFIERFSQVAVLR